MARARPRYQTQQAGLAVTLVVSLGLAALLFAGAMPLPWHHRLLESGGYTVVHGIEGDNWLIAAALVAVVLLVRVWREPPGFYIKWLTSIVAALAVLGIFIDYIDWNARTAQANQLGVQGTTYFGPGFWLGLAGIGLLVLAAVLTWRVE